MSDSFKGTNIDSNQIIYRFILKNKELGKFERSDFVAKEVLKWTGSNSLLTESLCQMILARQDKVQEGEEEDYVEKVARSLAKNWEDNVNSSYYQHFKVIKDSILQNSQVTTVLLRLYEVLLQTEVLATESLEDTILLNSGLIVCQGDKLKIATPIDGVAFNSEWVKQQLNQIDHKLISTSEESTPPVTVVEKKSLPIKLWAIIAIIGLGSLWGMGKLFFPWFYSSSLRKCNANPVNLDVAVEILAACDRIVDQTPNNTEALINRGKASLVLWNTSHNQERIDKAISDFAQARELEPTNPRAAFYQNYLQEFQDIVVKKIPHCLPVSDRYRETIELYQPFDKITTSDLPILLELGNFLVNREQNYETAITIFDSIINFDPKISQAWAGKATAQFLAKDYFNAQESLNQALAMNPDSYQMKYNLGSLWAKLGNYEKASQLYQEVTKIEPDFALAWRDLGLTLYLQNRYQEAALAFTQIIYRPNSESFKVSDQDRELMTDYYERVEHCLDEGVEGRDISCSHEDRVPLEVNLNYNGIFHNIIVHGDRREPFFDVQHHAFFQCFNQK